VEVSAERNGGQTGRRKVLRPWRKKQREEQGEERGRGQKIKGHRRKKARDSEIREAKGKKGKGEKKFCPHRYTKISKKERLGALSGEREKGVTIFRED